MIKELKEMEYEEAPSGFVTLYNYKEPFMPFKSDIYEQSFGYEGVLLFDGSTDKVQCHLCGKWYESLGTHLGREHNMLACDYKNMVGLSKNTALIGEKFRQKLIANGKKRFLNLRPGIKKTESEKQKIRETLQKPTREYQNLRGTCPYQLIDRILAKAKELGRTPGSKEMNCINAIEKVYGTYNKAVEIAGLVPRKSGQTTKISKYTKDYFYSIVREFWIKNGKFPKWRDFTSNYEWDKYKKFEKDIQKHVLYGEGKFQKTEVRVHYSKEELLDILRVFVEKNKRDPSVSDCKRGLLPYASRYYYHFGSLKKALKKI